MHVETYPVTLVWLARKKTNEKTRIYMKNRASALFVDSIYDISIY